MQNNLKSFTLEICCYSASDAILAHASGAHRVELCSGYEVGGTTPSIGAIAHIKSECNIPLYIMIRPRGGNFYYSQTEKKTMLLDIEAALNYGASGIVFGALNADGHIDVPFSREVMNICKNVPVTFHRAIDVCANYINGINELAELGVSCVLTSGRQLKAINGINHLQNMQAAAKNKINIMVGSGVQADNILSFAKLGITHFHSSASVIEKHNLPAHDYVIPFNANLHNNERSIVSAEKVKAILAQLHGFFN